MKAVFRNLMEILTNLRTEDMLPLLKTCIIFRNVIVIWRQKNGVLTSSVPYRIVHDIQVQFLRMIRICRPRVLMIQPWCVYIHAATWSSHHRTCRMRATWQKAEFPPKMKELPKYPKIAYLNLVFDNGQVWGFLFSDHCSCLHGSQNSILMWLVEWYHFILSMISSLQKIPYNITLYFCLYGPSLVHTHY